jgi:hypothetical protein
MNPTETRQWQTAVRDLSGTVKDFQAFPRHKLRRQNDLH